MPKSSKRKSKQFKRLQRFVVPLAFLLIFASVGVYLLSTGKAASSSYQFQIAVNRDKCMDNYNSSTASKNVIDVWDCNGTKAQEWTIQNVSGGFLLMDGQGTCADDTGDGVGTNSSNRVYLQTYTCNSSDHAQIWKWDGQQLQNAYNNGCINDPGGGTSNGTQLIVYSCSPTSNNATWYTELPPSPSVSITSPKTGATVSGSSVSVTGKASVSLGSITSITLSVDGKTLVSCSGASSCSHTWNTSSLSNGTYTVKVSATTSDGDSAQKSESVKVSNAPPTPSPSPTPTPSPGLNPSPSPSPVQPSNPTSGSSSGKSLNVGTSSGSTSKLSVTTPSPSPTLSDQSPTPSTGPTVYSVLASKITPHSIELTWQGEDAASYTIKYGTDKQHLNNIRTLKSTASQLTFTLNNLPAGTMIYISITPSGSGASGQVQLTSFETHKAFNWLGLAISWVVFLVLAVVGYRIIKRKLSVASDAVSDSGLIVENMPVYPREDSAAQSARLNWWLPEGQQPAADQSQGQKKNPDEEFPDMYAEGRKRLEEEEKNHHPPGP